MPNVEFSHVDDLVGFICDLKKKQTTVRFSFDKTMHVWPGFDLVASCVSHLISSSVALKRLH